MIEIIYAGNKNVLEGIRLSTLSICKHCPKPLLFHVLTMDLRNVSPRYQPITKEEIDELQNQLRTINPNVDVRLYDLTQKYLEGNKFNKDIHRSYTPYCLLRLFSYQIEGIGDKVIYLDVDTMAYGNIEELFNIDVTDYELAGVKDAMGKYWINPKYINSGVLLINMKKVRETSSFEKALKYTLTHRSILIDQNAINSYCKKKLYLDNRFNNQRKMTEDTIIKHFCKVLKFLPFMHCENIKQWHFDQVRNKLHIHHFDDIYEIYFDLTKEKERVNKNCSQR